MGIEIDEFDEYVPNPAAWADRHLSVRHFERLFAFGHLPEGPIRNASVPFALMAEGMLCDLPDSQELAAGLRKLLEAKDCFVRCAVLADPPLPNG